MMPTDTLDDKVEATAPKKKAEEQEKIVPLYFPAKFTEKNGKIVVDPSLGIAPGAYALVKKKKYNPNQNSENKE